METKANPNPNGCLAKALPDEPFFVLLARDPCAPGGIRHWADERAELGLDGDRRQDAEQLTEALETADAMEVWRGANDGRWREPRRDIAGSEMAAAIDRVLECFPTRGDEDGWATAMSALEFVLARRIVAARPTPDLAKEAVAMVTRHIAQIVVLELA